MFIDTRSPAYLVATGSDERTGITDITVHGRWSHHLGVQVCATIRDGFAERPAAMIIDLHELADPDGDSMPLWLATRKAAGAVRPPVRLALCLPATGTLHRRLRRLGPHHLPLFTTMPEAQAALGGLTRVPS
jgi:hypothetical protein